MTGNRIDDLRAGATRLNILIFECLCRHIQGIRYPFVFCRCNMNQEVSTTGSTRSTINLWCHLVVDGSGHLVQRIFIQVHEEISKSPVFRFPFFGQLGQFGSVRYEIDDGRI